MHHGAIFPGPGVGRRALLAGAAALAAVRPARAGVNQAGVNPPGLNLPPGDAVAFRILRDGAEVGSHRIAFERRGDTTIARVAIDIAVSVAWVTVYRLTHRAEETWQGDRFIGMASHSDDNGTAAWMRTSADPAGALLVSGSGTEPYAAPPGALPSTYWNPAILLAPLFSSQDGRLCVQRVVPGPLESVPCVGGTLQARRHDLHGDLEMEVWYDTDDQWAHMRLWRYGSEITYLRA